MAGLGAALLVGAVAMTTSLAIFIVNEVVVASARGRTGGDRVSGFRLEVPGSPTGRLMRLGLRAAPRFGVAGLALSLFGLFTQVVGENVAGVLVGAAACVALLVAIGVVGARRSSTVLDRICGIRVTDARHPGVQIGGTPSADHRGRR